ncbi:MAG: hypothetical protein C0615_03760 [Desulfuromonas sp.]|nr:MAG: hypothetical protein C0615_03760 [Desulfuromonas sp.]
MKANLSRQLTLLGFGAMAFYGAMLASGQVSIEILPQFAVSAIFFLFSGKIMRQMAARLPAKEEEETDKPEIDWAFRTAVLNWVAATAVIAIMTLLLIKPPDMTYLDLLQLGPEYNEMPIMAMP